MEDMIVLAGIVVTSVTLGYMLRLCQEIKEIARKGICNE